MKIAVTSSGPTLDDSVEARFGRCPYFLIVEPDTMAFEALENPNISLGGGAGPQSAQLMADQNVSVVLTGNCGPNAFRTFGASGIQIITGVGGRVRDAVDLFKAGRLHPSPAPSVQDHFGMGCKGGGRGMGGGGRFRGIEMIPGGGFASPDTSPQTPLPREKDEVEDLKQMAESLRRQIEEIESRISRLENQPSNSA